MINPLGLLWFLGLISRNPLKQQFPDDMIFRKGAITNHINRAHFSTQNVYVSLWLRLKYCTPKMWVHSHYDNYRISPQYYRVSPQHTQSFPMRSIGFLCDSYSPGKTCRHPVMPHKHLQCRADKILTYNRQMLPWFLVIWFLLYLEFPKVLTH